MLVTGKCKGWLLLTRSTGGLQVRSNKTWALPFRIEGLIDYNMMRRWNQPFSKAKPERCLLTQL